MREYISPDKFYSSLLEEILYTGCEIESRNANTITKFGLSADFNSTPLISSRRTAWKHALLEWEWFMSGSNDINDLDKKVRHWWEPWANESGYIHNNYGKQFRKFDGHGHNGGAKYCDSVDQIQYMIDTIKNDPHSRRSVMTAWHTHDMMSPKTAITNCHSTTIQAYVDNANKLHLATYQRSADMILGVPHNFIQMWSFLLYLAHHTGRGIGTLKWFGGICHIYPDHIDAAKEIVKVNNIHDILSPDLVYTPTSEKYLASDFSLSGDYYPIIRKSLEMTV